MLTAYFKTIFSISAFTIIASFSLASALAFALASARAWARYSIIIAKASFCLSVRGRLDFWIVWVSSSGSLSGISAIIGSSKTTSY